MFDSPDSPYAQLELPPELLALQEASERIVFDKRLLPGETLREARMRVATQMASVEERPEDWVGPFYWALHFAFPGGRIMANAGAQAVKSSVSTINCTVSQTIRDSMEGIMEAASKAALTLKAGCGIGYEFSTLRPKGAYVSGAGAYTSGPLPFMDIFDSVCKTVSSAGGRRGAQMGVLESAHPDIEEFITAKRQDGRLRAFNLSLLVGDDLIEAVNQGEMYALSFPAFPRDIEEGCEIIYRRHPAVDERFAVNEAGQTACKVYRRVDARDLWDLMMRSTFGFSDPGVLFEGTINRCNPLWFCEWLRATNPCGEQPLPLNGACLLGSVMLASFVKRPFQKDAEFNYPLYRKVVRLFARMLDNVVEFNGLPLQEQRDEIFAKRRHGMGYLGLGSAMTMLGMSYGDQESIRFTADVTRELAVENWRASLELAKEKGPAPILTQDFAITNLMLEQQPKLVEDGYKAGDLLPGRVLHTRYSTYMQRIAEVDPELVDELEQVGARFTHATSLAPTGTMAAGEGNNASNGIEPSFAHYYTRNMIVPGKKTKEAIAMYSYELLAYKELVDPNVDPSNLPEAFQATADGVSPEGHVDVQAAAQYWVDSAISKTINVPTDIDFESFKGIYLYAHKKGLKGCTTFRFNPEVHAGVLVRPEDLERTIYEFTLADGSKVRAKGCDLIDYDGNTTTAANLYDALKEGTYGRY